MTWESRYTLVTVTLVSTQYINNVIIKHLWHKDIRLILKKICDFIVDDSDPSSTIKFLEEGLLMKDFDHMNVLGLVGLTFDPSGKPLIILPLMSHGDLKSFVMKAPKVCVLLLFLYQ